MPFMSPSNSSSIATPAREFPQFLRLPAELRNEIWLYCLPHRVRELDRPVENVVFWTRDNHHGPWPCELDDTTNMNGRPPLISRVCRESRAVVLKNGSFMSQVREDRPPEAQWTTGIDVYMAWQDPARDSVHLNWESAYGPEYGCTDSASPLHCLAWEASHMVDRVGSLNIEYLDDNFPYPNPFAHIPGVSPATIAVKPGKLRDLQALKLLSNWLVVMKVIIVHSDVKSVVATDLFGLLGEERVQVVDVCEQDRIEAYFSLAEKCERKGTIKASQDFSREPADSLKQKLRDVVMEQFRSEELAASMRPAIMFRLCTQMCNHVGYEYNIREARLERYQERYRSEHGGNGRGRCRRVSCCGRRAKA